MKNVRLSGGTSTNQTSRRGSLGTNVRGFRRAVGVLVAAGLVWTLEPNSLLPVLVVWYSYLLCQILFARNARHGPLIFTSLTLYATTAWLALRYAREAYPPWPSTQLVQETTVVDLRAVILAYGITELLIGMEGITNAIDRATFKYQFCIKEHGTKSLDTVIALFVFGVGLHDCLRVALIGIGNIMSSERRTYASELLMGGNHNIQVLCIAATIWLVCRIVLVGGGLFPLASLISLWLPFFLVGSRKEAITTAAIIVILLTGKFSRRTITAVVVGGAVVFVIPAVGTGDIFSSLHEFILPQYMHFSMAMGLVPEDLGGSFVERSQFLLPAFLRITQITDLGSAFYALDLAGVGVGASPFAEAALVGDLQSTELSFAIIFLAIAILMVVSSRIWPGFTCAIFGLILVYGRSDFWTFMFFAVYISILLWLIRRFGRIIEKRVAGRRLTHRQHW